MLRIGVIESILTPATVSPPHRPNSYAGETSSATNNESRQQDQRPSSSSRTTGVSGEATARTLSSSLNIPVSRSSYMTTTSTASRMSGLSDFPVPPKDHRLSVDTYSNEPLPPPFIMEQQQLSLGSNQDVTDLAKTSSSSSS
jgi:hypothetical protein